MRLIKEGADKVAILLAPSMSDSDVINFLNGIIPMFVLMALMVVIRVDMGIHPCTRTLCAGEKNNAA